MSKILPVLSTLALAGIVSNRRQGGPNFDYRDIVDRIGDGEQIDGLGARGLGNLVPSIKSQQLDPWISDAMTAYALEKRIPKTFGVEAVPTIFYHRHDYPTAGFTAAVNFFGVAPSDFVTNFDGASGLAPNYGFMLESIGVDMEYAMKPDGTIGVTSANAVGVVADVDNALAGAEAIKRVYNSGRAIFGIAQKQYCDIFGLKHMSVGAGAEVAGFGSDTTTAGAAQRRQISNVNNGAPFSANQGFSFPRPIPILPGDRPKLSISFQTAHIIPVASTIRAQMRGVLFRFA